MNELYKFIHSTDPIYIIGIAFIVGVALLALKIWYRYIYGIVEVLVGIYLVYDACIFVHHGFSAGLDRAQLGVTSFQLIFAIYLICSGLDNASMEWRRTTKQ